MTSEEMEKAIQFILDQQAKAEVRQAEHERQTELEKKELRQNIQSLTNAVGVLAIQADKDRTEIKVAIDQMSATATAINSAVVRQELRTDRLEDQANKDRQAMVDAVDKLINSISNVHRRVSHLEDKQSN
jgi:DNA replication protein DnaD